MSSAPVILGTNGVTLTSKGKRWNPRSGLSYVEVYEGPISKAEDYFDALVASNPQDEVGIEYRAPLAVVTLSQLDPNNDQTDEDAYAVWELNKEKQWKPLLSADYFAQASPGLFSVDIPVVDEAIEKGQARPDNLSGWGKRYYALRQHSVEGFNAVMPVVRKTFQTSARNVADIIAGTDLVGEVVAYNNIPGIPTWVADALADLPARKYTGTDPDPDNYTLEANGWEWLVEMPVFSSIGKGKQVEVVREWYAANKWSKAIYGKGGSWDPTGE